jgi:peroxiredoxin
MKLSNGDKAPDFSIFDTEKRQVNLTDYKGKNVVLLFFPFAFTSVCTTELCGIRDDISYYNGLNAVVFGISVDAPFSLKKFKEEQNLGFEILSDFNKEVSSIYGTIYDTFTNMNLRGVSKRSAFVIDKEGIIRYAEVLEDASHIPDIKKIKEILKDIS